MKQFTFLFIAVFSLFMLQSCEAIGTIFEAGMYWGIFLVVALVALVLYFFTKGRK